MGYRNHVNEERLIGYIPKEIKVFSNKKSKIADVKGNEVGFFCAVAAADNESDVRAAQGRLSGYRWIQGMREHQGRRKDQRYQDIGDHRFQYERKHKKDQGNGCR